MRKFIQPLVLLVLLSGLFVSCNDESEVEYVTEEELLEEGLIEYVDEKGNEVKVYKDEYIPPDFDPDTVPDIQDAEPEAATVEDLRNNLLTDGKLDTEKVVAQIIHTLKYMGETKIAAGFVCTDMAYLASPILLPMKRGQTFTYLYTKRNFGKKRYHFILMNFKGIISGKSYSVTCNKELLNYKEIFVFMPENDDKTQRTQTGILLAMADEYLKDTDNMVNVNWQVGGKDASFQEAGTFQVMLKKDLSGYVKK